MTTPAPQSNAVTFHVRAGVDYNPGPMQCPCGGYPEVKVTFNDAEGVCSGHCGRRADVALRMPPNCRSHRMYRRHMCNLMSKLMREWNVDVLRPAVPGILN